MNEFITQIKKNGAVGVLAMLFWYTHKEVQELKIRLYDCYGKGASYIAHNEKPDTTYFVKPKDELNLE